MAERSMQTFDSLATVFEKPNQSLIRLATVTDRDETEGTISVQIGESNGLGFSVISGVPLGTNQWPAIGDVVPLQMNGDEPVAMVPVGSEWALRTASGGFKSGPNGIVGVATSTATQSAVSTSAVYLLSSSFGFTFTALDNHYYEINLKVSLQTNNAPTGYVFDVTNTSAFVFGRLGQDNDWPARAGTNEFTKIHTCLLLCSSSPPSGQSSLGVPGVKSLRIRTNSAVSNFNIINTLGTQFWAVDKGSL